MDRTRWPGSKCFWEPGKKMEGEMQQYEMGCCGVPVLAKEGLTQLSQCPGCQREVWVAYTKVLKERDRR